MGTRGRKSSASLATIVAVPERVERMRPPHDLTDEEVEVWAAVTSSVEADWFSPATVPLLAQYCRHCVHARRVAEVLEKSMGDPEMSMDAYDRLLRMQERESKAIAHLATKMRIAQQSTANWRGNKRPTVVKKPWD